MRNKSKTTSSNNQGGRGHKKSNSNSNNHASRNAKSGKPDKTKGLESHVHDTGKSECHVKTTKFTLSHVRQEHELGNDITTVTEDGEERDFTADMPTMPTTEEPRRPSEKASQERVADDIEIASHVTSEELLGEDELALTESQLKLISMQKR